MSRPCQSFIHNVLSNSREKGRGAGWADKEVREKIYELKGKYRDIFGELTPEKFVRLGGPVTIHMRSREERKRPYKAKTARRPAKCLQEKSRKLLKDLAVSGVIKRVYTPTEWCSPAMFVPNRTRTR